MTNEGNKISEEEYIEKLHTILEELSKLNISGDFFKDEIRKYILLIGLNKTLKIKNLVKILKFFLI